MNNMIRRIVGLVVGISMLVSCTSIDSSTSKALDACEKIEDEEIRVDCIVRVAETDPDQ